MLLYTYGVHRIIVPDHRPCLIFILQHHLSVPLPTFYFCKVVTGNMWLGKCTPVLAFTQTLTRAQPGCLILKMAVSSALDSSVVATRSTTPPSSCVFSPLLVACGVSAFYLNMQGACTMSKTRQVHTASRLRDAAFLFLVVPKNHQVRSSDDRWCQLLTSDTASHVPVP